MLGKERETKLVSTQRKAHTLAVLQETLLSKRRFEFERATRRREAAIRVTERGSQQWGLRGGETGGALEIAAKTRGLGDCGANGKSKRAKPGGKNEVRREKESAKAPRKLCAQKKRSRLLKFCHRESKRREPKSEKKIKVILSLKRGSERSINSTGREEAAAHKRSQVFTRFHPHRKEKDYLSKKLREKFGSKVKSFKSSKATPRKRGAPKGFKLPKAPQTPDFQIFHEKPRKEPKSDQCASETAVDIQRPFFPRLTEKPQPLSTDKRKSEKAPKKVVAKAKPVPTQKSLCKEAAKKKKAKLQSKSFISQSKSFWKEITHKVYYQKRFFQLKNSPYQVTLDKILSNIKSNGRRPLTPAHYRSYCIMGASGLPPAKVSWFLGNMRLFSYRCKMRIKLEEDYLSNDVGWGCMIRAGQMLFFNLLLKQSMRGVDLGAEASREEHCRDRQIIFRHIVRYFDYHRQHAPFSFPSIFKAGMQTSRKLPGDFWDSPMLFSVLEQVLCRADLAAFAANEENLRRRYGNEHLKFVKNVERSVRNLRILRICDGKVSEGKAEAELSRAAAPLLVMPFILRLGKDKSEKRFAPFLFSMLALPWFSGMIGGKRQNAFFFFGSSQKPGDPRDFEQAKLLYLDPHFIRDVA